MTNEGHTVKLSFNPRRVQVSGVVAEASSFDKEGVLLEQSVADAIMGACIIGSIVGVEDLDQYLKMIIVALPNAQKAAEALMGDDE